MFAAAAAAAAVAATLVLILPQQTSPHEFMLRTASGRPVAEATMSNGDSHSVSLALTARHLPVDGGQMFVLWAGDNGSSMQVGRFMVDRTGGCRVRFNRCSTCCATPELLAIADAVAATQLLNAYGGLTGTPEPSLRTQSGRRPSKGSLPRRPRGRTSESDEEGPPARRRDSGGSSTREAQRCCTSDWI
jgi:hypothetical protein